MNFRMKDNSNFARNLPQLKEIAATLGREVAPFIMSVLNLVVTKLSNSGHVHPFTFILATAWGNVDIRMEISPHMATGTLEKLFLLFCSLPRSYFQQSVEEILSVAQLSPS